jgi:hypothetical protein
MEYTHQKTGVDSQIKAISGSYTIEHEKRLKYKGRDILCVIGIGIIDSSCCGVGGCRFAFVPGYICQWKKQVSSGEVISQVEPIFDENVKKEIHNILKKEELITQIDFW